MSNQLITPREFAAQLLRVIREQAAKIEDEAERAAFLKAMFRALSEAG